jgi:hypothetical protein
MEEGRTDGFANHRAPLAPDQAAEMSGCEEITERMNAVIFHGPGQKRWERVEDPRLEQKQEDV